MRADFKCYWTPTARLDHKGRSIVIITDDNGNNWSQALKFASLAWGQVTPAAKLGTAGMPLRGFGRAFPVDHIDENKTNNNVSNAMIMTKAEHNAKTRPSAETIANQAMSQSAPCTMTVFVSKGKPLLDSEEQANRRKLRPSQRSHGSITSLHQITLQILLNMKIAPPEIAWSRSNTKVRTAWRNSPGTTCPILKVKFGNPSRKPTIKLWM